MGTNQNNNNRRIPFLFIMLAILMVVYFLTQSGQQEGTITYKEFKHLVNSKMVRKVDIHQNRSVPTGTVTFTIKDKDEVQVVYVSDVGKTTEFLDSKNVEYTLDNIDHLVIKDVAEAGGYGVVFGENLTQEQREDLKNTIINAPRRFIAQEVIDFKDLPILEKGEIVERKADLRAFVLSGGDVQVWPSGLTRFSRNPDSFVVNSSQGGGFKDTWIVCQ